MLPNDFVENDIRFIIETENVTETEADLIKENDYEKYELVTKVIALQVSIYVLRRAGGVCGSNIDSLRTLLGQAEYKLFKQHGIENINSHIDF